MRQEHRAGEKLFVDYAGQTVPVVDRETGGERQAQIFVAVLGASSYTFAEATWTQTLPDWTASHVRAFEFYGGCPEMVVPDNLRSGVSRAHRYEPDLNPTYHDLARHYGVAGLPARVRRPRDKAKAEVAVQVVERWILAALRHGTFFSLVELNAAIAELLERLNTRRFRKLRGSRRSQFDQLDRPALRPLPVNPYVFAEWKAVRVSMDYHVEVDGHYYSVPHALVRRQLDGRLTARTVECFHRGQRVASHVRSPHPGAPALDSDREPGLMTAVPRCCAPTDDRLQDNTTAGAGEPKAVTRAGASVPLRGPQTPPQPRSTGIPAEARPWAGASALAQPQPLSVLSSPGPAARRQPGAAHSTALPLPPEPGPPLAVPLPVSRSRRDRVRVRLAAREHHGPGGPGHPGPSR